MTTCRPSSATANRDRVRCSSAVTKRAQRRGAQPVPTDIPSTMTRVSRTSSTSPLPRERNHSPCDPAAAAPMPPPSPPGLAKPAGQSTGPACRTKSTGQRGRGASRPRRPAEPPSRRTVPWCATSRDGSPVAASQASASRPATIAAVLAALAWAQLAAATLTVRHGPSAGHPVRGSTMWCTARPSRRHLRPVTDDVASAPAVSRTTCSGRPPPRPRIGCQSATATGQPPVGGRPPDGDVAAQADQDPAASAGPGRRRGGAIRPEPPSPSRRDPGAPRPGRPSVVPSSVTDRQPAPPPAPPGAAPPAGARPTHGREVAVVPQHDERAAHRRIYPASGPPGRGQRRAYRLRQPAAQLVNRARLTVDKGDLRVVAEPAGFPVEPLQFGIDDGQRQVQVPQAARPRPARWCRAPPVRRWRRRRRCPPAPPSPPPPPPRTGNAIRYRLLRVSVPW